LLTTARLDVFDVFFAMERDWVADIVVQDITSK